MLLKIRLITFIFCLLTTATALSEQTLTVPQPTETSLLDTLEQVRELREQGVAEPIKILLPPGAITLSQTIRLDTKIVGNGLRLQASEIGKTIFTSGLPLKSVGLNERGEWTYQIPEAVDLTIRPRLLIIDEKQQSTARYPDAGYLRIEQALPDRRSGFVYQAGDLLNDFVFTEGICDLILLHDWSSSRLPVAEIDTQLRTLKTVGPIGCQADHYKIDHFEKQPRYWLEGHHSFANLPGEWYINANLRTVHVVASADSETAPHVSLPVLTELLVLEGQESRLKNLVLQGLVFSGTQFPMPAGGLAGAQATMHEPRNLQGERTTTNRPMLPAAVRIENSDRCQILSCRFEQLGGTGLWLGQQTTNSQISRCRFSHLGGNGINLGEDNSRRVNGKAWYQAAPEQISTNNKISECEIRFCGEVLPGSVGIWIPLSHRVLVENNHIHDCPYTGISLGWMWNPSTTPAGENRILNNKIEFVMQVLSDGAGIYTLGNQPHSIIENNIITSVPLNAGRAESNGCFHDQGTTGFVIRNNTFRRIDRSPVRFHQAGKNTVSENRWELASSQTPPVQYNNTPEKNIEVVDNQVLEPQKKIFLIGNSLTWDTIPARLDETVYWHVDCGKPLKFIYDHPENPCVGTSRHWPVALRTMQFDYLSLQPHYGGDLQEDFEVICRWLEMQPLATCVIHTGWARSADLLTELADTDPTGPMTHSRAYFDQLLKQLRERYPQRNFLTTDAFLLLEQIQEDIAADKAPIDAIEKMYRDAIHMDTGPGRYLMHNQMRKTLGQPKLETDFPEFEPELKSYLDYLLESHE